MSLFNSSFWNRKPSVAWHQQSAIGDEKKKRNPNRKTIYFMNQNEFDMQIRSLAIKVIIGDDEFKWREKIQIKSKIRCIAYKGWTDTDCHVSFDADVLNEWKCKRL